jgi:hypothetical protein
MSNLVLDRIKRQSQQSNLVRIESKQEEKIVVKALPIAISPDKLKNIFMSELVQPEVLPPKDMVFGGIQDFVAWLVPVKDSFTPEQIVPLSTLIQARDMIEIGCGCKRANRIRQANDYFKTFWINNQANDLPQKVIQVGNFSSISFAIDNCVFLRFDAPTL